MLDADAGVGDGKPEPDSRALLFDQFDDKLDESSLSELDRVAEQVSQNLPKPDVIPDKAGRNPLEPGFGEEDPARQGVLVDAEGSSTRIATRAGRYLAFYEGVAAAILDGARPPVDPADARDGLRILAAARDSAASGRVIAL